MPKKKVEKDSKDEIVNLENKKFIEDINTTIGNTFTKEVVKGLLSRASYSFESLYSDKLKTKIEEQLKDIEEKEIESKKVFIYIRMFKNPSTIYSGKVKEKELDTLISDAVQEYKVAFDVFEQNKNKKVSYNEIKKIIKENIEGSNTAIDESIKEETKETTNTFENITEPENDLLEDIKNLIIEEKQKQEQEKEPDDIKTKILKLLEENKKIDIELIKAKQKLDEKINYYNIEFKKVQFNSKRNNEMDDTISKMEKLLMNGKEGTVNA